MTSSNWLCTDGLKYLIYRGLRKGLVHPLQLAQYDVVVTSYDVMKEELDNALTEHLPENIRNFVGTPLKYVNWYRCILDECQVKFRRNLCEISAKFRWKIWLLSDRRGIEFEDSQERIET